MLYKNHISSTATATLISSPPKEKRHPFYWTLLPLAVSFSSRQLWLHRNSWNWNRPWWSHWGRCFRGWRNPKEIKGLPRIFWTDCMYISYIKVKDFLTFMWMKILSEGENNPFHNESSFWRGQISGLVLEPASRWVPCATPWVKDEALRCMLELWRPTWVIWKVLLVSLDS